MPGSYRLQLILIIFVYIYPCYQSAYAGNIFSISIIQSYLGLISRIYSGARCFCPISFRPRRFSPIYLDQDDSVRSIPFKIIQSCPCLSRGHTDYLPDPDDSSHIFPGREDSVPSSHIHCGQGWVSPIYSGQRWFSCIHSELCKFISIANQKVSSYVCTPLVWSTPMMDWQDSFKYCNS